MEPGTAMLTVGFLFLFFFSFIFSSLFRFFRLLLSSCRRSLLPFSPAFAPSMLSSRSLLRWNSRFSLVGSSWVQFYSHLIPPGLNWCRIKSITSQRQSQIGLGLLLDRIWVESNQLVMITLIRAAESPGSAQTQPRKYQISNRSKVLEINFKPSQESSLLNQAWSDKTWI